MTTENATHSADKAGHTEAGHSVQLYYNVFGALIVLLILTLVAAELPLGAWGLPVAGLVATTKAALILLFFMHVAGSRPLIWLIAGAGFFWMAIMFVLTLSDYVTRT